jgi:transcriptional regulator with XRE-family HTH domain
MNPIGKTISLNRKRIGMTQQQLADHLFVSPQAVSKWENSQSEPDLATLKKLSELFDMDMNQFFDSTETRRNDDQEEDDEVIECAFCGEELIPEAVAKRNPKVICKDCSNKMKLEEATIKNLIEGIQSNEAKSRSRISRSSVILSLIVAGTLFGMTLAGLLLDETAEASFGSALQDSILGSGLIGIFFFQMTFDSWLRRYIGGVIDAALDVIGLVTDLSFEGFLLLIIINAVIIVVLFVIAVIIALAIAFAGLLIAVLITPFSFIYEIVNWRRAIE